MQGFILAIDGPVASGKGTVAPLLASQLKGFYMNTGAIFRMLGLFCKEHQIEVTEENVLKVLGENTFGLEEDQVLLNGLDVSANIYHADISELASKIAAMSHLHEEVIKLEKKIALEKMAQGRIVILEGRNIGTAVFPDAGLKIFLTASVEKRAERRFAQMEQRGEQASFEQVLTETKDRDARDVSRPYYPLVEEPEKYGYVVVDTTNLTEQQTLDQLLDLLKEKGLV